MQGKENDRAAVNRSRLFIALSMAIFGTIGLFVRNIPLPSAEIALYRALLAILAIGAYLLVTGQKLELSGMRRELILLIISGIAMGLIKEGDDYAILTAILGDEDHLGDMDFKVTGTDQGITALQMDIKITSITFEIMEHALAQAKDGRMHILGKIEKAIKAPRKQLSEFAPQAYTMKIDPDKVREVIGKGGSVIQALTRETNTQIELEDDGSIKIMASNPEDGKAAMERIKEIIAEPEEGQIYQGVVSSIKDFGLFVKILKNFESMVHISEITGERLPKIEDAKINVGDTVYVKYMGTDKRGKTRLSMVGIDQKTGKEKK